MKKILLTLLSFLCLSSISTFAETVTLDPNAWDQQWQKSEDNFTATLNGFTLDLNKANSSSALVMPDKVCIKVYANAELVITAPEGATMTDIQFTVASGSKAENNNAVKLSTGWTISGTVSKTANSTFGAVNATGSNTITINPTAQLRISKMVITYTGGSVTPTINLNFAETEGTVNIGETLTLPDISATVSDGSEAPAITYNYSSDQPSVATVSETGVVTGVAVGTATITATCAVDGYDVKDAKYTLKVIDPNQISVELNSQAFKHTTSSYDVFSYVDELTGTEYSALFSGSTTFMQFNTGKKNGKNSGINVTKVSDNYIIKSIEITFIDPKSGVDVYASDEAFTAITKTGSAPSVEGATKLNTSAITNSTTIDINKKAFTILPAGGGAIQIAKVTVYYELVTSADKPGEIVVDHEPSFCLEANDDKTELTVMAGTEITFSSENAAKMEITSTDTDINLPESVNASSISCEIPEGVFALTVNAFSEDKKQSTGKTFTIMGEEVTPAKPSIANHNTDAKEVTFSTEAGALMIMIVQEPVANSPMRIEAQDWTFTPDPKSHTINYSNLVDEVMLVSVKSVTPKAESEPYVMRLSSDGDVSGIEGVEAGASNGKAVYYNLQGQLVDATRPGLYIRCQGGRAEKVLVR